MKNRLVKTMTAGLLAAGLLLGNAFATTPTSTPGTQRPAPEQSTQSTQEKPETTQKTDAPIKTQVQSTQIAPTQREVKAEPEEVARVKRPAAVDASHAILVEAGTGNVMWSKNAYQRTYPASTTKLMTAILFWEEYKDDLDKTFTVGKELDKLPAGSSTMGIKEGQIVTAEQLLVGLMLLSGNDAALTIAENCGGQDAFVDKMNQRAREYGMDSTHFKNPHGFHHAEHYTTAADFAKLARQYYKNDYLMQISGTKTYKLPNLVSGELETIYNTNRLMGARERDKDYAYEYATGIKTGYTDAAKNCIIASAAMGDNHILLVAFGSSNSEVRFTDAKALLSYGLTNFEPIQIYDYIKDANVQVDYQDIKMKEYEYGVFDTMIQINAEEVVNIDRDVKALLENEGGEVSARFSVDENLSFPIKEGDLMGTIEFVVGEESPIYSTRAIAAKYYVAREIPALFTTLRINQEKDYDQLPYFQQVLTLGGDLVKENPGKLEKPQKEQTTPPAA